MPPSDQDATGPARGRHPGRRGCAGRWGAGRGKPGTRRMNPTGPNGSPAGRALPAERAPPAGGGADHGRRPVGSVGASRPRTGASRSFPNYPIPAKPQL